MIFNISIFTLLLTTFLFVNDGTQERNLRKDFAKIKDTIDLDGKRMGELPLAYIEEMSKMIHAMGLQVTSRGDARTDRLRNTGGMTGFVARVIVLGLRHEKIARILVPVLTMGVPSVVGLFGDSVLSSYLEVYREIKEFKQKVSMLKEIKQIKQKVSMLEEIKQKVSMLEEIKQIKQKVSEETKKKVVSMEIPTIQRKAARKLGPGMRKMLISLWFVA